MAIGGLPGGSVANNLPAKQETWVQPLGQEDPLEKEMATHSSILAWNIPLKMEWQPTQVFLPGEFHGQRSLVGYSPWGHPELVTNERLTLDLTVPFADLQLWFSYPKFSFFPLIYLIFL